LYLLTATTLTVDLSKLAIYFTNFLPCLGFEPIKTDYLQGVYII